MKAIRTVMYDEKEISKIKPYGNDFNVSKSGSLEIGMM